MELIVDSDNMQRAWKQVKANKGVAGIDGMTIDDFPAFAKENWETIRQALKDGTYQPTPLRRVTIPKPGVKGVRMLGIPIVLDRLITQAVSQVLTPIFDPGFSESSFGSRPKRSAHGALRKVQQYISQGYGIAVDLDLEKFFDKVNHDVLMSRIARKVSDKTLPGLIGRYLRAGRRVKKASQSFSPGDSSSWSMRIRAGWQRSASACFSGLHSGETNFAGLMPHTGTSGTVSDSLRVGAGGSLCRTGSTDSKSTFGDG